MTPGSANPAAALWRGGAGFVPLIVAGLGVVLALTFPAAQVIGWTQETGWIETISEWLYLAPIALLALWGGRILPLSSRLALIWIFAFMMLREQDFQYVWGYPSWMKVSFYLTAAPLYQKLISGAAMLAIFAAMGWVVWRHARGWLANLRAGDFAAWTTGVFLFMLAATKAADRTPNIFKEDFGLPFGDRFQAFVSFFEEAGEMTLPILGAWAVAQALGLLWGGTKRL